MKKMKKISMPISMASRSSLVITCLVVFLFVLVLVQMSHQPFNYDHQENIRNELQMSHHKIKHIQPLIPRLSESIINEPDGKALAEFYKTQACPSSGGGGIDADSACIMDLLSDTSSTELQARITNLRHLAQSIMNSKNITCGHPKILGIESVSTDMEFCFWDNDFVSNEAMKDFAFEESDWQWVVRMFNNLKDVVKQQDHDHHCLAFLDAGVNVGDWATPITGSLPNVAYFGIEGSPPTAAISSANMLTMVHNQKYGEHSITTNLAPRALVPFPVMSEHSLMDAKENGGVCFNQFADNIGGQGITNTGAVLNCEAKSTAGAAYFPSVLLNLASTFQPNCVQMNQTKTSQHWPSVYIAKFDIQGFEFQALSPAIAWLEKRPPCYIMLEFCNHERQNYALMQLLVNVVGYDAVWRNSIFQDATVYEQPPQAPHWTKSDGTELWTVYEQDMEGKVDWSYINYIFGFVDQEACIKRLIG